MIAPLRRRHRLAILILSVALPGLLYMAVSGREPIPRMAAAALPGPPHVDFPEGELLHTAHLLLSAPHLDDERLLIEVALRPDEAHPRSLLYWHPDAASADPFGDGEASFLSTLGQAARQVELPGDALPGTLLLWDVTRGELRDEAPLSWIFSAKPGEHRSADVRSLDS